MTLAFIQADAWTSWALVVSLIACRSSLNPQYVIHDYVDERDVALIADIQSLYG